MFNNNAVKKQRVLVVDDQPKLMRFIEIDLKLRGFEVVTTTSGEEALKLAQAAWPDIMLVDIIMPEMDGFELLRRLRSFTRLPVIALSASHGSLDEAMRCGANDFLNKPFRSDEIVRRIGELLGRGDGQENPETVRR